MGNQRNRIKMADCRHPIAHADCLVWQVALFTDEIGNAVGQELDNRRLQGASRDYLKQKLFGSLPKPMKIIDVVGIDGLTHQGVQEVRERLCLKPM